MLLIRRCLMSLTLRLLVEELVAPTFSLVEPVDSDNGRGR